MNVGAKFDRFLTNIQLTDPQLEDAQRKHHGVRRALHEYYYVGAYDGSTSILAGSYGKNTAVRPPTDVDILFIMPDSYYQRYDSYKGNGQSQLLQDVKGVLASRYPTTAIRGDGQVVVVSFANSFGVEVVPVFRTTSTGVYLTPDTHSGGSWKTTNPSAEKKAISDSNADSNGNTVHLIKMLKVWKRYCSVPLSSLAIELLSVPFIQSWPSKGKSSLYYDWMIRDFFQFLPTRKNSYAFVPGISELYSFGEAWVSKAETALERAKKACDYDAENDQVNNALANLEWQKIFGGFFGG